MAMPLPNVNMFFSQQVSEPLPSHGNGPKQQI